MYIVGKKPKAAFVLTHKKQLHFRGCFVLPMEWNGNALQLILRNNILTIVCRRRWRGVREVVCSPL